MSAKVDISLIPTLLPGEKVLGVKKWIWAASGKSRPTYRGYFLLPPIQEMGIYVTDRRILAVSYFFRILQFDADIWFSQYASSGTEEIIQRATVGRMPVLGNYLEIISEDPVKHWYRSRHWRLRLFMRDPQPLCGLILEAMGGGEPK